MIEGTEHDERIDRLLDELAAYGVIDVGAKGTTETEAEAGVERNGSSTAAAPSDRSDAPSGADTPNETGTTDTTAGVESVFAGSGEEFRFDDAMIKENLEAILLGLISVRDGAHGKRLMGDLADVFGAQLSPGTVYPRLHDLEAAGVLQVHELVRTKEYTIADEERARKRMKRAMGQHLALGAVFRSALEHVGSMSSNRG